MHVTRHNNKLKVGHLKGNRFTIRIRNLSMPPKKARDQAGRIMEILCRRGVPNYFGPQRFGYRYDSHILGEAIIKDDVGHFFDIFLGKPELDRQAEFIESRTLYEKGDLEGAFYAWHSAFGDHRRALKNLMKFKGNLRKAFRKMDRRYLKLLVCAWQSDVFNRVLAERLPLMDTLLEGDMAYKHDNGACFRVDEPSVEQPRCDAFAISPTGPLLGKHLTALTGTAGAIENRILETVPLTEEDLDRMKRYGAGGERRPLRFEPTHTSITTGCDDYGDFLQLRFELPSGCYATVLLRKLPNRTTERYCGPLLPPHNNTLLLLSYKPTERHGQPALFVDIFCPNTVHNCLLFFTSMTLHEVICYKYPIHIFYSAKRYLMLMKEIVCNLYLCPVTYRVKAFCECN